jgi:multidrug resistance protein MdtO
MATLVTNARQADPPLPWFWQLLKEELAPYPGRIPLVARMVTATTIVMIMTMTFRIPYGAYGAVYALTISRESPRMTASEVNTTVFAFAAGAVYVLTGFLAMTG